MSFLDFLPTGQTRAVSPKTAGQVRSWNPLHVSGAVGALGRKQAQTMSPVQFSSVAQSCPTLCDPMDCSTPGFPVHHELPEFTQTHIVKSVMPSSHLILCRPLLLPPSVFPGGLRNFLCSPLSPLPSCRAGWGPRRGTWDVVALCRILPLPPHPWQFQSQWPGVYAASAYRSDTRADLTFSGATNESQTGECSGVTYLTGPSSCPHMTGSLISSSFRRNLRGAGWAETHQNRARGSRYHPGHRPR